MSKRRDIGAAHNRLMVARNFDALEPAIRNGHPIVGGGYGIARRRIGDGRLAVPDEDAIDVALGPQERGIVQGQAHRASS